VTAGASVSSLRTSGVVGVHEIETALEHLLQGTSMTFRSVGGDTIALVRVGTDTGEREVAQDQSVRRSSPDAGGVDALASLEQVKVTGSRIARRDLQAASPILTVDSRALQESATFGIESILNRLPQFVPSATQFSANDVFPSATNTPGISPLNLRGLGNNRTLVLIDGRRAQPANSTLVIDVNSVPSAAIESVEIISGGASAVYGADAMAGVVNFKFKNDFEGASFEYRGAMTERGDGEENRFSALLGANTSNGRGNVMLGMEWWDRSQALAIDHPFYANAMRDSGSPATLTRLNFPSYQPNAATGGLPSQQTANELFPQRLPGVNVNRATPFLFNTDASLFKEDGALGYTGPLGDGQYKLQPSGFLGENNLLALLSSPLRRYSVFGKGHHDITDQVSVFAQMSFVNAQAWSRSNPVSATGGFAASIPRDAEHPVPAELATLLDSRGPNVYSTTEFDPNTGQPVVLTGRDADWLLGWPLNFLPTRQLRNSAQVLQLLVGFNGKLGWHDWTWEAYVSRGDSQTDSNYIGFATLQRYRAVVEAPFYGRGLTLSGEGQTSAKCTSGLPVFETFAVSQDCVDAITAALADRTRLTQNIVEANFQGGLFDLTAGQVRGAAGISYRRNDFEFLPDSLRETNSIIDIPVGSFANANVRGDTSVKEVYGELLVPLLREKRFAETLELELGGRYSQYDTAGSTPTYKGLLSWAPNRHVRLRGGYQFANREPNINELFLGESAITVTTRGPDPCRVDTRDSNGNVRSNPNRARVQALCSALIGNSSSNFDADPDNFRGDGRTDGGEIELRQGNTELKSEEGETYTAGIVLRSPLEHPLARDATLTVDWYRIRISEAIAFVSAQTTYDLCFNRDGISNPEYSIDDPNGLCRRILRDDVTGNRTSVSSPYMNLGRLETSGVDTQVSWRVALEDLGLRRVPGTVSLDVLFNKLITYESQDYPTQEPLENAGTLARNGLFSYRTVAMLSYALGGGHASLTWRHLPSIRNAAYVTDPSTPFQGAESYDIFNLAAGWSVKDELSVTVGVDNLMDRDPNRMGIGPGTNGAGFSQPQYYDVLGRRYYLGVRVTF